MNKGELVAVVADAAKISKKSSEEAVNAILNSIADTLAKGDKVSIVGFGNFEVRQRAERKGRNPATSEEIIVPASKAAVFKPGKALKERINK